MEEVRAGPDGLGSRIVQLGLIFSGSVDSPQSFLRVFKVTHMVGLVSN